MEEEKREHELKMKKMEAEMEQVFEMKVKEKKQKLKDSELELTRRHEERKKVKYIKNKFKKNISSAIISFTSGFRPLKYRYVNQKKESDALNKRDMNGKTLMALHQKS